MQNSSISSTQEQGLVEGNAPHDPAYFFPFSKKPRSQHLTQAAMWNIM